MAVRACSGIQTSDPASMPCVGAGRVRNIVSATLRAIQPLTNLRRFLRSPCGSSWGSSSRVRMRGITLEMAGVISSGMADTSKVRFASLQNLPAHALICAKMSLNCTLMLSSCTCLPRSDSCASLLLCMASLRRFSCWHISSNAPSCSNSCEFFSCISSSSRCRAARPDLDAPPPPPLLGGSASCTYGPEWWLWPPLKCT